MDRVGIDPKRSLKEYLLQRFFSDVHTDKRLYEKRPIYFPLSSKARSFVAYVSIHRWNAGTLRALLAEYLEPERKRLEGERSDLRKARQGKDKNKASSASDRYEQVSNWLEELELFIKLVKHCAEKGPPPTDSKCNERECDARYDPDLDDGVMINAAALWPLLEPQWKDPAKWWKELANAESKKDYDWSHLAARYFPGRVDKKCQDDPSLAVAHKRFWKYHPEKAYQWELRLKHEIGPDFTLDEPDSDAARKRLEKAHPDKVKALVAAELKRRKKKDKGEDEEAQGALELEDAEPDNDNEAEEAPTPPARKRRRA